MTDRDELEGRIRAACDAMQWADAATLGVAGYGPEILSFLYALAHNEADAGDAFSRFCENLWIALPGFQWVSSFRTWAYVLARHSWYRELRQPHRRRGRGVPLSDAPLGALAERVKTATLTHLRSEVKDRLVQVRSELAPDDQTLLILRVDRQLPWRDIARVMSEDGADVSVAALDQRAASLRKRFERLKAELKAKIRPRG